MYQVQDQLGLHETSLKKLEKEVEAYHSTCLDSLLVLICNKLSYPPVCAVSMAQFFFAHCIW